MPTLQQAHTQSAAAVGRAEGPLLRGLTTAWVAWARALRALSPERLRQLDLPWPALDGPALRGWNDTAGEAMRGAGGRGADGAGGRGVVRKADEPVPFGGLALTDAERRALVWLEARGLDFVRDLRASEVKRIREVLQRAQVEGWDVRRMRNAVVDSVGLDPRRQLALERFRDRMEAEGLWGDALERRVQNRADAMRRQRAETIARTETVRARNQGRLSEWTQMQNEGDLPTYARKRWVAAFKIACPICRDLHAQAPIPLQTPFSVGGGAVLAPPAHPNCRCTIVVV